MGEYLLRLWLCSGWQSHCHFWLHVVRRFCATRAGEVPGLVGNTMLASLSWSDLHISASPTAVTPERLSCKFITLILGYLHIGKDQVNFSRLCIPPRYLSPNNSLMVVSHRQQNVSKNETILSGRGISSTSV